MVHRAGVLQPQPAGNGRRAAAEGGSSHKRRRNRVIRLKFGKALSPHPLCGGRFSKKGTLGTAVACHAGCNAPPGQTAGVWRRRAQHTLQKRKGASLMLPPFFPDWRTDATQLDPLFWHHETDARVSL